MYVITVIILLVSSIASAESNPNNRTSAIGINLTRNHDYQTGVPWVNAMRMARAWRETPIGNRDCTQNSRPFDGKVDAHGYPTELGTRECIFTHLFATNYATAFWPLGSWVLRYDGDATFDVSGAGSNLIDGSRRATFDVGTADGGLNLEIRVINPANPPRNIRLYPPGGVCATNSTAPYEIEPWAFCSTSRCRNGACKDASTCGEEAPHCIDIEAAAESQEILFHPLWLSRMVEYRTVRFMDWLHTNHSTIVEFSDWRQQDHFSWNYKIEPGNVPLSAVAELCNLLDAECYVNVPHAATNANIVEFVRFFRDNVASHLPLYLEYSNEVWNGIFSQKQYAYEAGAALPESEFDSADCLASAKSDCANNYYGKRTFEMCNLAQQVMDETEQGDRLVCVMARQSSSPRGTTATSLDCPRWRTAPNGNCYSGSNVDMLAIAPYFGDPKDCSEASSIGELCSRMEDDIAAEYCQSTGCVVPSHHAVLAARSLAWPIMTYEGGSHQSDSSSPICVRSATGSCVASSYVKALDAWKNLAKIGGYDVRQYLHFDSMSHHADGGNLFGARGSMEGRWPKEDGLLGWKNTPGNECWWRECRLTAVPEPGRNILLVAGLSLMTGLLRLRRRSISSPPIELDLAWAGGSGIRMKKHVD